MAGGMIGSGRQMGSNALASMQRYSSETERQKAQIDMANKQIEQADHAQNVQIGTTAGMAVGAMGGALYGAEAGSVGGPVGAVVGAAVGAIVGMVGGELFG